MAASSNKSPSPTSNRQNPSSRSTDQNPIARRSLSGGSPFSRPPILSNPKSFNPYTPANSPSDLARNSGEFCSRAFEDKENEKDHSLKHTKVRSPAILKKGSKNFMAPTISAASKFTPSPRKKVLGEKNDSVRTSMSDSFEKVVERFEMNSELGSDENAVEVTFSDFHIKPDCPGDDDYSLKKIPISSSVSPSPPPYDPKTNYLSPRPQFLHFKPNPRIESYLGKENGEIKRLDDIFELENLSSDSEATEENESNDSKNESCEEDSSPEITTKEAEHQEEEVEVEEESTNNLQVSEPQEFRKSKFFSRLRFISLLMILVVGFLSFSATDSPIFNGSSVLKDSSIPKLYRPSELKDVIEEFVMKLSSVVKDSSIPKPYHPSELKDVLEEFVMSFKDWSSKHISSYVSKVMPRRNGLDKPPATIQFYNLSSFQEYALINRGGFVDPIKLDLREIYDQDFEDEDETEELQEENGHSEIEEEEGSENEIIESGITETESLPLQAEFYQNEEQSSVNDANLVLIQEVESSSVVGDDALIHEVDSSSVVGEEQSSVNDANLVLIQEVESPSVVGDDVLIREVDSSSVVGEEQSSLNDADLVLIQEVESPSVVGDDVFVNEVDSSSVVGEEQSSANDAKIQEVDSPSVVGDDVLINEVDSSSFVGEELSSSSSTHNLLTEANSTLDHILATISVLLVILIPAFLYVNHRQKRNEVNTTEATRVLDDDPAPCSSEASSFQASASVANKKSLKETAAAAEKRVSMKSNSNYSRRRESLASSSTEFSMDSPSYGSFTTYEKMVTKKNGYDEEIVTTPVRRSSRIRSQVVVTSP